MLSAHQRQIKEFARDRGLGCSPAIVSTLNVLLEPDHYLQTYLVEYHEISLAASPQFRDHYHLRGQDNAPIHGVYLAAGAGAPTR